MPKGPAIKPDAKRLGEFSALVELIATLRAPGGCPWDQEQTHRSLRPNLLEECYEVLDALDSSEGSRLAEELGDLLVQVVFHAQIAREQGEFALEDVMRSINSKLIRRHPHVFGDVQLSTAREVEVNWERIKSTEREAGTSLLEGVPKSLPALARSQALQERASRAGFDWADTEDAMDKAKEVLEGVRMASSMEEKERRMGDLLFSLASVARLMGLRVEEALRQSNARFESSFSMLEKLCQEKGMDLVKLSREEKEALWQWAKKA